MKPNGRRRWRKWLARERKGRMAPSGRGTEPWCWWASCDGTRVVRRHRGGEWVTGSLPDLATMSLPDREFSARSLCGMTQGARKRAVLRESQREEHWEVSAKYRIGERLRPCPGKYGCRNCTRTCGACEDQIPNDTRCRRCGSMMTTEGPFCDGSGVLPAKRHRRCGWWLQTRTAKNATQRCGMPTTDGWLDCRNCGGSGWLMGRERP